MEKETRIYNLEELEIRSNEGKNQIRGYAAVYRSYSEDLGDFIEVIEPGFFSEVLHDDVRSLFNHDPNIVLGRTKSGTLRLEDTPKGLKITNDLPDTQWGRDLRVSIERGDIDQMSFGFIVKEKGDTWTRNGKQVVRTLKRNGCARLVDISPVTYPAYPETSVTARSMAKSLLEQPDGQAADLAQTEAAQARREARQRQLKILEKGNY